LSTHLDKAIRTASNHLLSYQGSDGSFHGAVDFHIWANAAYLLLVDHLGINHDKKPQLISWVVRHQNPDGSWGDLTEKSAGNYRNTLLALASVREYLPSEQIEKATSWIHAFQGNKWLDPYTELFLSIRENLTIHSPPIFLSFIPEKLGRIFGKLHMKVPVLFSWSIFLFPSAWTRNAFPPLQIVSTLKNKRKLNFLYRNAIKHAEKKILELQLENGSWFDTALPTMGSIYALHALNYPLGDPRLVHGLEFLRDLVGERGNLSRFFLTVWDTSFSIMALCESGMASGGPTLKKAENFLLNAQTSKGGWAFGLYNRELPDNDDTSLAILALNRISVENRQAICSGIKFLLKMQNYDGGWGAFDRNQSYKKPGRMPPYHEDYGHELKDPSTADVVGHVLQALGEAGYSNKSSKQIRKAIKWLMKDQTEFGGWWGRWGICYIYGTTQALCGLKAAGENMQSKYVLRAVNWLKSIQNADGGWGEHYSSYYSANPILTESTVEQTSWALLALLDSGLDTSSDIIKNGINFLLQRQRNDGSFPSAYTAAAIDPGRYEIYAVVFPLYVLAKYRKLT